MPESDPAWRDLTLYLVRPEVADFAGALRQPENLRSVPLRPGPGLDGELFFLPPVPPDPPDWLDPLMAIADVEPEASASNPGAVLVFRAAGRMFAVPFGRGHHRLRHDRLVDDFGLRIAANLLNPDDVVSVDSRAVEQTVFLTRRGASRGTDIGALGLEADRESVHSLTGRPRDRRHGTRVTGRVGFMAARAVRPAELAALASDALASFGAEDYKEAFGVLDQRRMVEDDQRAAELTDRVVAQLPAPGRGGVYLAPPEVVDWANVGGFRFSFDPRGARRQEISIADYHEAVGGDYTLERLQEDRVTLFAKDSGRPVATWSVLKCLIAELREPDGAYVMNDGRWWQIHPDFLAEIDALVNSIKRADIELAVFRPEDAEEGVYNRRASSELPGSVALDQRFASFSGEKGRVELCDIAGPGKRLVHVKRGLRAASLSHLFAQAVGSGEALRNLPRARARLRELLAPSLPDLAAAIGSDSMHPRDWEVVIAIVTDEPDRVPGRLPFFSRAHLARSVRALRRMDYRVTYCAVEVAANPMTPPRPRGGGSRPTSGRAAASLPRARAAGASPEPS